ncbi:MAG: Ribosomal L38e protein family protein [Candidatus Bathyarchaeota archaeon B23]|nr:MAG: Ribosomal L38e protein family protein [Candidatus Bathyarchaeota archaeon B23]
MPREVFDPEEFLRIAERATECRIKRLGDAMKLKLRTSRYLYTLKINAEEGEKLLRRIKCPKREI